MIAVVGEALVDLIIASDGSVGAHLGGGPYNAARAAGRLGAVVKFFGTLSQDRFGTLLAEQLSADGVDISGARRVDEPTTLAAAELATDGSATYRFYSAGTSAPQFDAAALIDVDTAGYLFTGGLALVLQPMAAEVELVLTAPSRQCVTMVDLNCRPFVVDDRSAYERRVDRVMSVARIIKVSGDDLRYLYPNESPQDAARRIVDEGAGVVLLTDGDADVSVFTDEGYVTVPVPKVEIVDTVGAGDTFSGAFLASCDHRGLDFVSAVPALGALSEVVSDAVMAAAVACQRSGADPPRASELSAWPSRNATRPH
jgi:fructokinase